MHSFDMYLVEDEEGTMDLEGLLAQLRQEPYLHRDRTDPDRLVYGRRDTGVFFHVTLSPGLLSGSPGFPQEEEEPEDEESAEDPDEDPETEEDLDEEDAPVELPPVTFSVPLLSPSFFAKEAFRLAARLGNAGHLRLDHRSSEDGVHASTPGGSSASEERIHEMWIAENRLAIEKSPPSSPPTIWPATRAAAWWDYGEHRASLEAELRDEGVAVPILQASIQDGEIKTVCVWKVGEPTVLPRCDFVLIRVERLRKGILWSRQVTEEGLVPGERLWNLLAPFAEIRRDPVELLVFREARNPPNQVAAELEVLGLAPVEIAKRVELFGVIDFDLKAS